MLSSCWTSSRVRASVMRSRSRSSSMLPLTPGEKRYTRRAYYACWPCAWQPKRGCTLSHGFLKRYLRDTLVSVLAEVVRNYVEVRGLQRRLAIAQENIKAQQDTLAITRARFDAGLTNELDVTQAASQLATTQAQIPSLETSLKQGIHRLGVLIGQAPGALLAELSTAAPIPTAPPEVLVGLPAELLRCLPDVRRAERQL